MRRIVTAVDQVELLSPWLITAAPDDRHPDLLAQLASCGCVHTSNGRVMPQYRTAARIAMPWYHVSPHDLPDGTHLTPGGGKSPYADDSIYSVEPERAKHVWVTDTPGHANDWAEGAYEQTGERPGYTYEVEPHADPQVFNHEYPDDEWTTPGATIKRKLSAADFTGPQDTTFNGFDDPVGWSYHKSFEPSQIARSGASAYASQMGMADPHSGATDYLNARRTPQSVKAVAQNYASLPMHDPAAVKHFDAMRNDVLHQHDFMTNRLGIKTQITDHDPYSDVHEMLDDVNNNKRLQVLGTHVTGGHPYLDDATNDKFRAVHDLFGHAATGRSFDRHGEQAAYLAHSQMFSPAARPALATETRGQNSALVYGGGFAPQKTALIHPQFYTGSGAMHLSKGDPSYLKGGKCEYCKDSATKSILHSEGMAYVQTCDKHLQKGKDAASACVPFGEPDPGNINKIYDLATKKVIESRWYHEDDFRHSERLEGTRPIVRHPDGSYQELTDWVHQGSAADWTHDPETDSYTHPSGHVIAPSDESAYEGMHQLWAPTVSMAPGQHGLAKDRRPSSDLQKHFDWVERTGATSEPDAWSSVGHYWFNPDPTVAHSSLDVAMPVQGPEHAEQILSQYPRSHRLKFNGGKIRGNFNFGTDVRSGEANETSMKRYQSFRARAQRNGHPVNFVSDTVGQPGMTEDDFHGHIGLQGPDRAQELHDARAEADRLKFAPRQSRRRPMARRIMTASVQMVLQEPWRRDAVRKGAPFAGYDDFDACTSENSDKRDPSAYCGEIKHRTEDKKASRWYVAVDTHGMDPESHAYATEERPGPGPGRHYNPDAGYEPSEHDERRREAVGQDDDSGYNWGPESRGVPESQTPDSRPTRPSAQWGADVMRHLDKNPGGVTIRDQLGDAPDSGYMVAPPDTEEQQSRSALDPHKIRDYYDQQFDRINQEGNSYGGWDAPRTSDSGKGGQPGWYHDVPRNIKDPGEATDAALSGNQQSVYDLGNDEEVSTPDMVKRFRSSAVDSSPWYL